MAEIWKQGSLLNVLADANCCNEQSDIHYTKNSIYLKKLGVNYIKRKMMQNISQNYSNLKKVYGKV